MFKLYYIPLNSECRVAKLILHEKKIKFSLINEPIWKRREQFLKINPEGSLPVVINPDGNAIIGYEILAEYLDEVNLGEKILGKNSSDNLEIRRLSRWIGKKFNREVTENIVDERVFKSLKGLGEPSSETLKAGRLNLKNHLEYFEWLLKKRSFLAGETFSLADLVYSSFLSSLDYLGEINWDSITFTKKWYAQIKSRPSFRDLLEEKIYEVPPSRHYSDLDF